MIKNRLSSNWIPVKKSRWTNLIRCTLKDMLPALIMSPTNRWISMLPVIPLYSKVNLICWSELYTEKKKEKTFAPIWINRSTTWWQLSERNDKSWSRIKKYQYEELIHVYGFSSRERIPNDRIICFLNCNLILSFCLSNRILCRKSVIRSYHFVRQIGSFVEKTRYDPIILFVK